MRHLHAAIVTGAERLDAGELRGVSLANPDFNHRDPGYTEHVAPPR